MKSWKLYVGVALLALVLAACSSESKPTPDETPNTGEVTQGEDSEASALYQQNCITCHGTDLKGVGRFPNLEKVGGKLSSDEIADIIENGKGAMRAFKGTLTEEEITTLADWLAAKK